MSLVNCLAPYARRLRRARGAASCRRRKLLTAVRRARLTLAAARNIRKACLKKPGGTVVGVLGLAHLNGVRSLLRESRIM